MDNTTMIAPSMIAQSTIAQSSKLNRASATPRRGLFCSLTILLLALPLAAFSAPNPCPRFAAGSTVPQAPDLYSTGGVLMVNLAYNTATDAKGLTLYCFTAPDGSESPTLHVNPGDTLIVNVKNNLPVPAPGGSMTPATNAVVCGNPNMDASSVNIHYHGTNTSPACHGDEVIHTLINSGESFTYSIVFPADEPPGMYWYHPHVHGLSEAAVLGGASGAIEVEGIQNIQPAVANLPERILVIRDQPLPDGSPQPGGDVPSWDLSVNYVPITYPLEAPAQLSMKPGERQLWRVINAGADTILQLQLVYGGVVQPVQVVALDGVPLGSQDGTSQGVSRTMKSIILPPAGRAEFIVTAPTGSTGFFGVSTAFLTTLGIDTGPDGDNDPPRNLIAITTSTTAPEPPLTVPPVNHPAFTQRFSGLKAVAATAHRQIYFSEDNANSQFYITVQGATPALFGPNNPPAITTKQGSVEDWVISNRTMENHEFHIHQIHFLLLERDGVPVGPKDQQMLDTIDIPYWDGSAPAFFHSVKVRMDFRGPDTGDFVFHCHILEHEDGGMMGIIRITP